MGVTCPVTVDPLSVKLYLPGLPGLASGIHLFIFILLCPQPGEIQKNPNDKCTFFSCVQINNQLISSVSNITCPDFDSSDCVPVSGTPLALSVYTLPGADPDAPATWFPGGFFHTVL